VGEALVSFLDEEGRPGVVDRALVYPPRSQLPPLSAAERDALVRQSTLYGHYEQAVDRKSAYEMLKTRAAEPEPTARKPEGSWQQDAGQLLDAFGKSAARAIGSHIGREIIRGVLGSFFGTSKRRARR
ncbi:MAG TPA: helicase HerA-like domain-containing protein, partial [Candidatus Eisenbacteria bacterium]|nr:helicase HerA-like domain-containing protein [Candidatus Eisenbacteria bacterium]